MTEQEYSNAYTDAQLSTASNLISSAIGDIMDKDLRVQLLNIKTELSRVIGDKYRLEHKDVKDA